MKTLKVPYSFFKGTRLLKSISTPFFRSSYPKNLHTLVGRTFSYAASYPGNKNTNSHFLNSLVPKSDSSLASAPLWDDGKSIEDRFHLSQITDVKKVFSLLRQSNYKFPLNDLVQFLRRIVEINEEKHLKLNSHNSMELYSFIQEIKRNLQNSTQDYPLIGSYAWCFWKLKHEEDHDLWLTLGDYIIDERFYPNFNETMCGIEGFAALEGKADQEFINEVYKKLEKVLVLTIVEVNINHYRRITEGLVKVKRFTDYVFANVESHLVHFLQTHALEYDLNLMLDILACFAISDNGSESLFYSFQDIFQKFYDLNPEQQKALLHGDFISKMVQTYALAKMKYRDLVLQEDFKELVKDLVMSDDALYTLQELVVVVQHIWMFNLSEEEGIYKVLDMRLFKVKPEMKCNDMLRYIDLKVDKDHEGEYAHLPKEITSFFDEYLDQNMEKQSHEQIYNYICEVENRNLMFGKEELLNHLVTYVGARLHIYDFEELCYLFWIFNKYQNMVMKDNHKVQGHLNQIKDHIRLYSAFSKGKLQIGSNFYKMLEVVSGSDFLTQGEYPEW